jgi:predicted RNA methylase
LITSLRLPSVAEQGIAFVEAMGRKYDVVLMNPPFGAGSMTAKKDFESSYPRTKNDVYAAFVERGVGLLHAEVNNFGSKFVHIQTQYVRDYERLLTGGIWAQIDMRFV